jgi:GNAT superfamily N-acetyltransferase
MIVREATLDDAQEIVGVHLTSPDRPFERPVESLSIAERCGYGGPWMSVETCAIHLNNLLAWGHAPLVVEEDGVVIAETEFYIGRDIPPFGIALDISVLYVHADAQRRGAGSLLMEAMIARAREADCDYITVNADAESQGFYSLFGFSDALDLQAVNCDLSPEVSPCACEPYVPVGFEGLPQGTLWVGRFLSPRQKWREIADRIRRRDAILPEDAGRPRPVGRVSASGGFLAFLVPERGNPAEAEIYCWSERLTRQMVRALLAQAHLAGYSQACLLCHPEVTDTVVEVCDVAPSDSWAIWGKVL